MDPRSTPRGPAPLGPNRAGLARFVRRRHSGGQRPSRAWRSLLREHGAEHAPKGVETVCGAVAGPSGGGGGESRLVLAHQDPGVAVPAVEEERSAGQVAAREMGSRGSPLCATRGVPELGASASGGRERCDVSPPPGAEEGVVAVIKPERGARGPSTTLCSESGASCGCGYDLTHLGYFVCAMEHFLLISNFWGQYMCSLATS